MDTLVFKNTHASNILIISDIGVEVTPGEDLDLIPNFRTEDLLESTDIEATLSLGGEIWLNATYNLTYTEFIDYLTALTRWDKVDYSYITGKDDITDITNVELEELTDGSDTSLHIHDGRYYTETELQTPGSAQVDWANIINPPVAGNIVIINGDAYIYDNVRGKTLSISETGYLWSENVSDGRYMKIGDITSTGAGYIMPINATIVKIAAYADRGNLSKNFNVRVNSSNVYSFQLVGGIYTNNQLNIDLNVEDILQIFTSGSGAPVKDIVINVFVKWRS